MQVPVLPFKVIAFAPFSSGEKGAWRAPPVPVGPQGVDRVMEELGISLSLPLPRTLRPAGEVDLTFRRFADFHPDHLVRNTPFLRGLLEARTFVTEARRKGLSEEGVFERLRNWPDLPVEIPSGPPKPPISPASAVDALLEMVDVPEGVPHPAGESRPIVAQIDSILRQVLSIIFSNETFRNLESVWRGLSLLLKQGDAGGDISLEIVPVNRESLEETIAHLTPSLVEDLPSLILLDLPLDNSARSTALLERFSLLAEHLMAPGLCWISPEFFGLDRWEDLGRLPYLPHHLEGTGYAKWRRFKESSPAQWTVAICNRLSGRYPYGPDNRPASVRFEESHPLWVSPVWAMAGLIAQSLRRTGWPTRFTEWQTVRLGDLPLIPFKGTKRVATETAFDEDRTYQFIRSGITPLVPFLDKDFVFLSAETTLSGGSIAHRLFLSRVTRLLFWCKDHFPSDLEPSEIEEGLKRAFIRFWERSGHPGPKNLEIAVDWPRPTKPVVARISIDPSRDVLPFGQKIELEFAW